MPKIKKKTAKIKVSKKAISFLERRIRKSAVIGIGSGTTMALFMQLLGKTKLKDKIKVIPSSLQIENEARKAGVRIARKAKPLIAVDGADQITPRGILKGHGALAFTKEKEIDYAAKQTILIADKSKLSKKFTLPILIEVKKDSEGRICPKLSKLRLSVIKKARHNNNIVFFLSYKKQFNPAYLEKRINSLQGVIDNGIFVFKKKPIIITD